METRTGVRVIQTVQDAVGEIECALGSGIRR
jgi:hypothetical protein